MRAIQDEQLLKLVVTTRPTAWTLSAFFFAFSFGQNSTLPCGVKGHRGPKRTVILDSRFATCRKLEVEAFACFLLTVGGCGSVQTALTSHPGRNTRQMFCAARKLSRADGGEAGMQRTDLERDGTGLQRAAAAAPSGSSWLIIKSICRSANNGLQLNITVRRTFDSFLPKRRASRIPNNSVRTARLAAAVAAAVAPEVPEHML